MIFPVIIKMKILVIFIIMMTKITENKFFYGRLPLDTCAYTPYHFSSDQNLKYMIKSLIPLLIFGQQFVPLVALVELDLGQYS